MIIVLFCCLLSCQSAEDEETTGSIMEFEHVDPVYDPGSQSDVVQKFFLLDPEFIGEDFCYDHEVVQELILGDGNELPGDRSVWEEFYELDNYLRIENPECFVTLEFKVFRNGNKEMAYLNQVNKGAQRFDCLEFDEENSKWIQAGPLPGPALEDFFKDLGDSETELVAAHGYQFLYMTEDHDTLTYYFSDWMFAQELDGMGVEMNKEADYHFQLFPEEGDFQLIRAGEEGDQEESFRYFVAYQDGPRIPLNWNQQFQEIVEDLSDYDIQAQHLSLEEHDYQVIFPADTFDLRHMEQFEPRNGYWFFERGKEPLDLPFDDVLPTIEAAMEYFESDL